MALNFPANTSLPYVDPVSGLKYVYNSAVGAWEAAIQPPAIIADAPPVINIPGFLWWDNVSGTLYIWYQDVDGGQWVDATANGGVGLSTAYISETAPAAPILGELWWDSSDGRLYIYYDDGGSKQWIQATTGSQGEAVVNYGIKATSGATQPATASAGDLWYNTSDKSLYINIKPQGSNAAVWTKSHNVTDPSTFVTGITAGTGISNTGTGTAPVISARDASATVTGAIRIATVTEALAGTNNTVALTPGVLKEAILSYVTSASASASGFISLATTAEVTAGTVANKAVTPLTLKQALPDLGVPVGTIIQYGGASAPTGYLKCDGSLISRTTYLNLFQVIGTSFGIGDGSTTFKLPTLTDAAGTIKCIKF